MQAKSVTTKSGKTLYVPMFDSPDEIHELIFNDNTQGFCIACGEDAYGVEPDARRYECESCGENKVYGLEEIVMRGWVAYTPEAATK